MLTQEDKRRQEVDRHMCPWVFSTSPALSAHHAWGAIFLERFEGCLAAKNGEIGNFHSPAAHGVKLCS